MLPPTTTSASTFLASSERAACRSSVAGHMVSKTLRPLIFSERIRDIFLNSSGENVVWLRRTEAARISSVTSKSWASTAFWTRIKRLLAGGSFLAKPAIRAPLSAVEFASGPAARKPFEEKTALPSTALTSAWPLSPAKITNMPFAENSAAIRWLKATRGQVASTTLAPRSFIRSKTRGETP